MKVGRTVCNRNNKTEGTKNVSQTDRNNSEHPGIGLVENGKLIGIISHVSALKERIRTQINITPLSGGRSSLSGPGCVKVVKSE